MHEEGVTALMYAAAGGHIDTLNALLEAGAEVDKAHMQGGTALMEAATKGDMPCIEALLKAGANPTVKDQDNVTALMSAASQGHGEAAALFASKGVNADALASSGGSALMFAAAGGHADAVAALIKLGVDVNKAVSASADYIQKVAEAIAEGQDVEPHKDGVTSLMLAAHGGFGDVVDMLLEAGAKVELADDEDMTALIYSIQENHGSVAEKLIRAGADPNEVFTDAEGKEHNLVMDSIALENTDFALLLIEKGADLTATNDQGVTTLIQAAFKGLTPVVEKILASKQVGLNDVNEDGVSALIAAASKGHGEVVEMLCAAGADVNLGDNAKTTPMMVAAAGTHMEAMKFLLKHGANVNAQNGEGHTALMFAHNGQAQLEAIIEQYAEYLKDVDDADESMAKINEALELTKQVKTELLKAGADKDLKDNEGHKAVDFDYKPGDAAGQGLGDEL